MYLLMKFGNISKGLHGGELHGFPSSSYYNPDSLLRARWVFIRSASILVRKEYGERGTGGTSDSARSLSAERTSRARLERTVSRNELDAPGILSAFSWKRKRLHRARTFNEVCP